MKLKAIDWIVLNAVTVVCGIGVISWMGVL